MQGKILNTGFCILLLCILILGSGSAAFAGKSENTLDEQQINNINLTSTDSGEITGESKIIPISTWEEFQKVGTDAAFVSAYDGKSYRASAAASYVQVADLTAEGTDYTAKSVFSGIYDGKGHTIDLSSITNWKAYTNPEDSNTNTGLFGYLQNAEVHNLVLAHANINTKDNYNAVLAAVAESCKITDITILNSQVTMLDPTKTQDTAVSACVAWVKSTGVTDFRNITVRDCSLEQAAAGENGIYAGILSGYGENVTVDGTNQISGCRITTEIIQLNKRASHVGIGFGRVIGTISNVEISDSSVEVNGVGDIISNIYMEMGCFAGRAQGTLSDNKISRCALKLNNNKKAWALVGGVLGSSHLQKMVNTVIEDSTIDVYSASQLGTVIGNRQFGTDINCGSNHVKVSIHESNGFGGYVGMSGANHKNCFAKDVSVSGAKCTGSFAGYLGNIPSMGGIILENCYGDVKGLLQYGFAVNLTGETGITNTVSYRNCAWVQNDPSVKEPYNPNQNETLLLEADIKPIRVMDNTGSPKNLIHLETQTTMQLTFTPENYKKGSFCDFGRPVFTSADPSVVTVDANGVLSAGNKEGVTTVTAVFTNQASETTAEDSGNTNLAGSRIEIPITVSVGSAPIILVDSWEDFEKVGTGTSAAPVYIDVNGTQMNALASAYYLQTADIQAPAGTVFQTKPAFGGVYDGGGHTIDCAGINQWNGWQSADGKVMFYGLFATISDVVQNLNVRNARIGTSSELAVEMGVIAGVKSGSARITKVSVDDADLSSTGKATTVYIGGICGVLFRSTETGASQIVDSSTKNITISENNGATGTKSLGGAIGLVGEAGSIKIENITVNSIQIITGTDGQEGMKYVGGAIGTTGSGTDTIRNVQVFGARIHSVGSDKTKRDGIGGVVASLVCSEKGTYENIRGDRVIIQIEDWDRYNMVVGGAIGGMGSVSSDNTPAYISQIEVTNSQLIIGEGIGTNNGWFGGLVGVLNPGMNMTDCHADMDFVGGNQSGTNWGGIYGLLNSGTKPSTFESCWAEGSMKKEGAALLAAGIGGGMHGSGVVITYRNCFSLIKSEILSAGFSMVNHNGVNTLNYENCMWVSNFAQEGISSVTSGDDKGITALQVEPRTWSTLEAGTSYHVTATDPAGMTGGVTSNAAGYAFAGFTAAGDGQLKNAASSKGMAAIDLTAGNVAAGRVTLKALYTRAGYPDIPIEYTIQVKDTTGPTLAVEFSPDKEWTNKAVTVTVNASDTASGLAASAYSFDGGKTWQEQATKQYTENTTIAANTIQVRDVAGNITKYAKATNISNIDKTAPIIDSVTGNPTDWTKNDVTLTFTATDNQSGLHKTEGYSFDGGKTWKASGTLIVKENGTYSALFKDAIGNISAQAFSVTVDKIDKTNPEVTVHIPEDPSYPTVTWQQSKKIHIKAVDTAGGIKSVKIIPPTGSQLQEIDLSPQNPVTDTTGYETETETGLSVEGIYTIVTEDSAGNKTEKTIEMKQIDTTAPITGDYLLSTSESGTLVDFTAGDWQDGGMSVVGSGVKTVHYAAKEEGKEAAQWNWQEAEKTGEGTYRFTITDPNVYHYVKAEDQVGNISEPSLAYDSRNLVSAAVPLEMMFAVIAGQEGENFYAPDYEIRNTGTLTKLNVKLTTFVPSKTGEHGFSLVDKEEALGENQIMLYLTKGTSVGNAFDTPEGLGERKLLGTQPTTELTLGTLLENTEQNTTTHKTGGTYTFTCNPLSYQYALTGNKREAFQAGFKLTAEGTDIPQ